MNANVRVNQLNSIKKIIGLLSFKSAVCLVFSVFICKASEGAGGRLAGAATLVPDLPHTWPSQNTCSVLMSFLAYRKVTVTQVLSPRPATHVPEDDLVLHYVEICCVKSCQAEIRHARTCLLN